MSRGNQQRRSRMCKGRSEVFKSEYPHLHVRWKAVLLFLSLYKVCLTPYSASSTGDCPMKTNVLQNPVRKRIARLREEIAQIREASRVYMQSS